MGAVQMDNDQLTCVQALRLLRAAGHACTERHIRAAWDAGVLRCRSTGRTRTAARSDVLEWARGGCVAPGLTPPKHAKAACFTPPPPLKDVRLGAELQDLSSQEISRRMQGLYERARKAEDERTALAAKLAAVEARLEASQGEVESLIGKLAAVTRKLERLAAAAERHVDEEKRRARRAARCASILQLELFAARR
jgi:hypothetical protein